MYISWLNAVSKQLDKLIKNEGIDLILLRNNLKILINDIEKCDKFKAQLAQYEDKE